MMTNHDTRTDIKLGEYIGRSRSIQEGVIVTAAAMSVRSMRGETEHHARRW